jgi:hypothetical protein
MPGLVLKRFWFQNYKQKSNLVLVQFLLTETKIDNSSLANQVPTSVEQLSTFRL